MFNLKVMKMYRHSDNSSKDIMDKLQIKMKRIKIPIGKLQYTKYGEYHSA